MKLIPLLRSIRSRPILPTVLGSLQTRSFQPDFDPHSPRPPPSDKIIQLAEEIAALSPEEHNQIGPALIVRTRHPKMQQISGKGIDMGSQGGTASATKAKEVAEKTAFDVKLEKFDTTAKIKLEPNELVEKAPFVIKQQITKEEANDIIGKLKAAGGNALMEGHTLLVS